MHGGNKYCTAFSQVPPTGCTTGIATQHVAYEVPYVPTRLHDFQRDDPRWESTVAEDLAAGHASL